MKYFQIIAAFILLSLVGCGSEGRSSDIYYIQERDLYLRIYDDGEVNKYRCSVNLGYQEDVAFSGELDNNQLDVVWNGLVYSYQLEAGENDLEFILSAELEVVDAFSGASTSSPTPSPDRFLLEIKEKIPNVCTNSAIDIVSITPETWLVNSNNSITVNYNYRSQHEGDLRIRIAYLNNALPSFQNTIYGAEVRVEGMSQSNNTLTISVNSLVSSNDAISVYVLMQEAVGSTNMLISYDRFGLFNADSSKDVSINTDCLTCEMGQVDIGPFD
ncbi:MAG: hypothetical protein V7785_17400 [Bermanella sp.]